MSSEDLANLVKQQYLEMFDTGADPLTAGRLDPKAFETGNHINQPKKEK